MNTNTPSEPYAMSTDTLSAKVGPPEGSTRWQKVKWWFDFIVLVNLARLRFIAIIVAIGVIITQWDTLVAYYERWTRPSSQTAAASTGVEWFCPMHPSIIRDNPKDKCPICFMPLSKRKKGSSHADPLPAGITSRVQLSPYRVVLAGVHVWRAVPMALFKEITAVGYVEFNEEKQRIVSARVAGRIDRLFANQTGQMVNNGDKLALLYSPDLVVTMQSLLDARKSGNADLVEGSKTRLRLLGIDEEQIDQVATNGKAPTEMTIRSPITGHIIRKGVVEGQYVEEGTTLYEVADLSSVWIAAQIYEDDVPFLQTEHTGETNGTSLEGTDIIAVTPVLPDKPFTAKRAFVFPHVNPATRTVTLRFEVDNPGHQLRPGATATVKVRVPLSKMPMFAVDEVPGDGKSPRKAVLAVPETAVIDTGGQTIVYREASPGVYEGVSIVIGPRMSDENGAVFFPVLRGIEEGDHIVTSGSFLVDAETRLNPAAGSIYFGGSSGGDKTQSNATVRPTTPDDPQAVINAAFASLDPVDQTIARDQRYCPVLKGSELGSMGPPIRVSMEGEIFFVCCKACLPKTKESPDEVLTKLRYLREPGRLPEPTTSQGAIEADIEEALNSLSADDQVLARRQRFCVVRDKGLLGSMGSPVKIDVEGQSMFLCCDYCRKAALKDPTATLKRWKSLMGMP
ncbi:efflux RND transporter periplasmic adaptor subunit [bacterium]|nr:efflux RND transporter periplasmic adaptor subunit [bacterium]